MNANSKLDKNREGVRKIKRINVNTERKREREREREREIERKRKRENRRMMTADKGCYYLVNHCSLSATLI